MTVSRLTFIERLLCACPSNTFKHPQRWVLCSNCRLSPERRGPWRQSPSWEPGAAGVQPTAWLQLARRPSPTRLFPLPGLRCRSDAFSHLPFLNVLPPKQNPTKRFLLSSQQLPAHPLAPFSLPACAFHAGRQRQPGTAERHGLAFCQGIN